MPQFHNDHSYIANTNASRILRGHELRWGFDMAYHGAIGTAPRGVQGGGVQLHKYAAFQQPEHQRVEQVLNNDETIRSLGNFMSVTSANINGGQEPGDERQFRFGARFSF